jgi:hypothetical protein
MWRLSRSTRRKPGLAVMFASCKTSPAWRSNPHIIPSGIPALAPERLPHLACGLFSRLSSGVTMSSSSSRRYYQPSTPAGARPASETRLPLKLEADGSLPPEPGRYSGQLAEWRRLRESPEHQKAAAASRKARMIFFTLLGSGLKPEGLPPKLSG